ncbi:MAG TPA: hypothetical protein VGQ57_17210 [Polyangiaceae bacterium]|jgi:hypothetical protein|nr:hypothetical protein [Polyangiaceae bacterium]
MSLEPGSFFVSLLVSGVGFVIFEYGRRMRRVPQIAIGVALLIFPYFVSNVLAMLAIAVVLIVLLWLALARGM